jgi:hypothetical protein
MSINNINIEETEAVKRQRKEEKRKRSGNINENNGREKQALFSNDNVYQ